MAEEELQSRFSPNKPLEADVLGELSSIMRLHDISAEDLYFKWESYCIKMDSDAQNVTLSEIRRLKQVIQDTLEKDTSRATQAKPTATPRPGAASRRAGGGGGGGSDVFGMLDGLVPSTPTTGGKLGRSGGVRSGLKRKADTPKLGLNSSPAAGGMSDQLKSMNNGTP